MLIHEIFEAWVSKAPHHIAIVFEGQSLTYEVLNARANRLARYLRTLGVGPERIVAICLERCPDLVVALLAVLKAGGAGLFLDPAYPPERLAFMLKDARAEFVLTHEIFAATVVAAEKADVVSADWESSTGPATIRTVVLDRDRFAIDREGTDNPRYEVLPGDLALVFYTSGSTGIPKAVVWEHVQGEGPASLEKETFLLAEQDHHLLKAAIGFTLLTAEVFLPLRNGGQLIIVPAGLDRDIDYLTRLIAQYQITNITLVPSMLRALVEHDSFLKCTSLREICTFGEALPEPLQRHLYQHSNAALTIIYGATEAPSATSSKSDRHRPISPARLGSPMPGKEIYLLNNQLDLVGEGEQGEICVGGGLARGYLGRPNLTAEKFIPHPFAKEPGRRLYRTGDVGRYLSNGDIEFVGRIDNQLKVRGFRVEPAEIEKAICENPAISQAVVTMREDNIGEAKLIAYLTSSRPSAASSVSLRRYLKDKLPSHMIPDVFVALDAMPLTPNGKIDRHALPAPDRARLDSSQPFVAPRNALEREMAGIWQNVLASSDISMTDNFFDVGGNSLSAMYLLTYVNKTFSEKLPLAALYQAPTVEEFTKLLNHHERSVVLTSLLPLQPHGSKPPFFWIHGESSNSLLPHYLGVEQPVYGLGHQSLDGIPAQFTTVETIAAHYLEEIRTVQRHGPYFLGGYCFGGLVAFEIAQILRTRGDEVALLAVIEPSPLRVCGRSALRDTSIPVRATNKRGIREEFARHLRTLKKLGLWQQLEYVGIRLRGKVTQSASPVTNRVSRQVKSAVCAFCVRFGYALPVWVRSFYILRIYGRAGRHYALRTYPGSVDLFVQEPEFASPSSWDGLCTEAVTIHKVEMSDHTSILQHPHIRDWAGILAGILNEKLQSAQARLSRS